MQKNTQGSGGMSPPDKGLANLAASCQKKGKYARFAVVIPSKLIARSQVSGRFHRSS
jgi:hypothetical protein